MDFSKKYAATATRVQLICVRDEVQEALRTGLITSPLAVRQAREAIRDIEREMVARWEVSVLISRRRRTGSR